ncbi:DUF3253 domain-containing protein [Agrococcus jejuensis]|nr:DUF3253 domain-containing protein [Agrococcus jejuensis]
MDRDADLERTMLRLVDERAPDRTICPSDVARAVGDADSWRSLMDATRAVAARLADAGEVEVTQRGTVVDARTARGPVRIRRPR